MNRAVSTGEENFLHPRGRRIGGSEDTSCTKYSMHSVAEKDWRFVSVSDRERARPPAAHSTFRRFSSSPGTHNSSRTSRTRFPSIMLDVSKPFPADASPEDRIAFLGEVLSLAKSILEDHPGNRCCKYLLEYLDSDEGKNLSNEGGYCSYYRPLLPRFRAVSFAALQPCPLLTRQPPLPSLIPPKWHRFRRVLPVHQDRPGEPRQRAGLLCHDGRRLHQVRWLLRQGDSRLSRRLHRRQEARHRLEHRRDRLRRSEAGTGRAVHAGPGGEEPGRLQPSRPHVQGGAPQVRAQDAARVRGAHGAVRGEGVLAVPGPWRGGGRIPT